MVENKYFVPDCCICRSKEHLPERHYYVYAIELDLPTQDSSLNAGAVYVGQSWHTPECRFNQHKVQYRWNDEVYQYGTALRPELFAHLNPIVGRTAALQAEADLAESLRARNYIVISG